MLVMSAALLADARTVGAQTYGAGPLTSSLANTEPKSGALTWGHVKIAPGMTVQEAGTDDNVFDEKENPKKDQVFRGTPDTAVFMRTRFVQLSTYVGSELQYYNKYRNESSVGFEGRGRVDLLLGRLQPFFGAAHTHNRTRPTEEIDVRARQRLEEVSGGIGYELGQYNHVFAGVYRYRTDYRNAIEDGIDLSRSMNLETTKYMTGVRTALTPMANLTLQAGYQEDRFQVETERGTNRRVLDATVLIMPEAVISGQVQLSYQDVEMFDKTLEPFRGVTSTASITYPFLEIGRLNVSMVKGLSYAFDPAEGYYKELTGFLVYTQRIVNQFDLQLRGSLTAFDYGFREGVPPHRDKLDTASGSLGYNLKNRTRVAVNYESARRRSVVKDIRDYDRHRWFVSWLFAF